MSRPLLLAAALLGLSGVALGAFGAHALAALVPESTLASWRTAVQYQLFHALALLALAFAPPFSAELLSTPRTACWQVRWLRRAGYSFLLGVLLFSGSLYALVLGGPRWLGPVTPVGGLALMVGWALLLWVGLRSPGNGRTP